MKTAHDLRDRKVKYLPNKPEEARILFDKLADYLGKNGFTPAEQLHLLDQVDSSELTLGEYLTIFENKC